MLDRDDETPGAVPDGAPNGGEPTGPETGADGDGPGAGYEHAAERGARPEPAPEEAISQPLADERRVDGSGRSELREAYGYVRTFFKCRPGRYRGFQRRLKQARVRDTYDEYLTESVRVAVGAAVLGVLLANALVVAVVATGGSFDAVAPLFAVSGTTRGLFDSYPTLVVALVLSAGGAVGAGLGVWTGRTYYYPRRAVAGRRRSIDLNLPYAITFAYALSRGGMNFVDVCRRLAEADDVYGEAANEFDVVVREIDLFGNDLLRALENARALTPSESLRMFLDDLLGVLESGGDLEAFLQEEAEEYLDDALEEQEAFVETLGALSELFVVAFVAAPLFLIVVLMVVSFIGAGTVGLIALLVYAVFPVGMVGFLLLVHLLSRPYDEPTAALDIDEERTVPIDRVVGDPRFDAYRRAKPGTGWRAVLSDPFGAIERRPVLSLVPTVPLGIGLGGLAVATGVVGATDAAFVAAPIRTTTAVVVLPLLTVAVPLMLLHERKHRRARRIAERFPDVLTVLASANEMGVGVVGGFELVTRGNTGALEAEIRKVRNDVAWNHDLTRALLSLADRLDVPQLTRTMKLIAEGSRSSGDLHGLLEIAAADTRARAKLDRARRREVGSYVAVVVVGFLVYLLVIVMVSASYLDPIAELAASTEAPDRPELLAGIGTVPVDRYRLLFLHSALVQGFGSGLLAGKLAENDVLSGLKYGIGLVLLTTIAFVLFV